jgi:DNA-binding response OmpR family regulator
MRILLVDDEKELVSTLAERLGMRGIDADWVTSGDAALKQTQTRSYDLAVLDIKIPGISGLTLQKILHQKYPEMKFIFITGHGSGYDFEIGSAEAGAENYLAKPVDITILIEKMHDILNVRGCS